MKTDFDRLLDAIGGYKLTGFTDSKALGMEFIRS